MRIVSIINLKGGCAKTTTAVSMAELLAEGDKGRKRSGVPMGRMFCRESCRMCEKHTPTKAEKAINANMAAVDDCFKLPVIKAIADLSNGKPMQNLTLEDTLETINKNLALLAKGDWMTVEQSAAVLTVAMDAYSQAKKGADKA